MAHPKPSPTRLISVSLIATMLCFCLVGCSSAAGKGSANLSDYDKFTFEAVTVCVPKSFGFKVDEKANVAEGTFWRKGSDAALLISRKPISDYDKDENDSVYQEVLEETFESDESFQKMVFESVAPRHPDAVVESINGRYYICYVDEGGSYTAWTVLLSETDTYWVNFYGTSSDMDRFHDSFVKMIDMVEIDHSYHRG